MPGRVVHSDATRDAFETLKARIFFAHVLLTSKSRRDAEFIDATNASKVGIIAGVLLQEDSKGQLRPCAYWPRKLKHTETRYNAYDKDALAIVEAVSRVGRVYLLGCKCFSVITDHATLVHQLKQSSDKLTNRQSHWVEKLMPYANAMRVLYKKGILKEVDPVSRRPDFLQIDLYRPEDSLWWDGNVPGIIYNCSDPALLAVTTFQSLNADDDFLSRLKWAYSSCNYFFDENIGRKKRLLIEKSSDGLFRYHHRVVISRPTLALIKALLAEYHDNARRPNYRRLMASLLKLFLVGQNDV